MPHLILKGPLDAPDIASRLASGVTRWRQAVLKIDGCWIRGDRDAMLVEGVVVEHSRALHPVAFVGLHHGDVIVRLWPLAPVERSAAVQRWLVTVAAELQRLGLGRITGTNLPSDLWSDLRLQVADGIG